jgi:hypothetical protein
MGDSGGDSGVVVVMPPQHRAHSHCSCGWVGAPRVLVSSAKIDALIHAARHHCEPAVPLVQPGTGLGEAATALGQAATVLGQAGTVTAPTSVSTLVIECPAGCGDTLAIPVQLTPTVSLGSRDDDLAVGFTAEAPELHDLIHEHLLACPSTRSWIDTTTPPRPGTPGCTQPGGARNR